MTFGLTPMRLALAPFEGGGGGGWPDEAAGGRGALKGRLNPHTAPPCAHTNAFCSRGSR
jgi:hypothetical protein